MKVVNSIEATPRGKITNAAVERSWQHFIKHGSVHSARGTMLTFIINRCEKEYLPYKLVAVPGQGYWIVLCDINGDDAI